MEIQKVYFFGTIMILIGYTSGFEISSFFVDIFISLEKRWDLLFGLGNVSLFQSGTLKTEHDVCQQCGEQLT